MKRSHRGKRATTGQLIESYRHEAALHGRATDSGDSNAANRAAGQLARVYAELQRLGGDARRSLLPLLHDEDSSIRLWAAAHALEFAPSEGETALESLAATAVGFVRTDATMTLKEWREGRLRFPEPT
jgi:hypothetical protein